MEVPSLNFILSLMNDTACTKNRYLVEANADLCEHAGLQRMVVVALHGGFDAAQAFLHRTGNLLVAVEVPWNQIGRQTGFGTVTLNVSMRSVAIDQEVV